MRKLPPHEGGSFFYAAALCSKVVSTCEIAQEDQPFIIYMYPMGQKVTGSILYIYQDNRNHEMQPHSRILFSSNWFLTYRTDVRIISTRSKIKMSMGRDAGGATISRNRSAELLRKCGMRSSRPGSSQNQSSCGRSGTEL